MSRTARSALIALSAVAALACGGGSVVQEPASPPIDAPPAPAAVDPLQPARDRVSTHGHEPIDPCDYAAGWAYGALADLNAAVPPPGVRVEDLADADPALAPLREDAVYRRWRQARAARLDAAEGIRALLAEQSAWVDLRGVPRDLTLAADGTFRLARSGADAPDAQGTWVVDGTVLHLSAGDRVIDGALRAGPYGLALGLGDSGTFEPYPPAGDCG